MPEPTNGGSTYHVEGSQRIAQEMRELQQRARQEGRGEEVLSAFRQVAQRLQIDPVGLGEPRYRLPALRMQIRCVAIRPLVVEFGVCEDRPLVFIKSVRLLALHN